MFLLVVIPRQITAGANGAHAPECNGSFGGGVAGVLLRRDFFQEGLKAVGGASHVLRYCRLVTSVAGNVEVNDGAFGLTVEGGGSDGVDCKAHGERLTVDVDILEDQNVLEPIAKFLGRR